jgi:hypothetical protein
VVTCSLLLHWYNVKTPCLGNNTLVKKCSKIKLSSKEGTPQKLLPKVPQQHFSFLLHSCANDYFPSWLYSTVCLTKTYHAWRRAMRAQRQGSNVLPLALGTEWQTPHYVVSAYPLPGWHQATGFCVWDVYLKGHVHSLCLSCTYNTIFSSCVWDLMYQKHHVSSVTKKVGISIQYYYHCLRLHDGHSSAAVHVCVSATDFTPVSGAELR